MSDSSLTGAQKSFVRGLGQAEDLVVKVGKAGLTAAFFRELSGLLDANELVKLRFLGTDRHERDELVSQIVAEGRCELAGQVGQTALLFRTQKDLAKARITLPETRK